MARRIPAVVAAPGEDIFKIGLSQPAGYANLNSGAGSWHWINPWWSGGMGDIQYTTQTSGSKLILKWQYNHSHGDTWRSGCVRQHMKNSSGNWVNLGCIGSTSFISGASTSGNSSFGCLKLNITDHGFSNNAGTTLTFSQQWRSQQTGNWTKMASFSVNNENADNGQAGCTRGGWSMNIEEVPNDHFGTFYNP